MGDDTTEEDKNQASSCNEISEMMAMMNWTNQGMMNLNSRLTEVERKETAPTPSSERSNIVTNGSQAGS